jgi:hypothetical protein
LHGEGLCGRVVADDDRSFARQRHAAGGRPAWRGIGGWPREARTSDSDRI